MPTSRQLIYIGFPVISLLIIFSGFLFIKKGAEDTRREERAEAVKEIKQIVDYAEAGIRKAYENHKADQQRDLILNKNAAAIIAEKSALILSNAVRDTAEQAKAAREKDMSGLEHILASFMGNRSRSNKSAENPASVIIEKERELKKTITGSKTLLSINSASGNLLWQNRMPAPATTYIEPVNSRASFIWNGKRTYWNISVHLPAENFSNSININQVTAELTSNRQLGKALKEGFTLAITDFNGKILTTLPEGAFPIKTTSDIMLDSWHEIDKGVYDKSRMRYLSGRQSGSIANTAILAQAIVFENSTSDWLIGQVSSSPELFILPAAVILITGIIFLLSFFRKTGKSILGSRKSPETKASNIKLVRKGNRDIPDDVDVILTEVGSKGNSVEVKALHGVKYPEPDRESNLKRLRDIYFQGREATNLDKLVRSDVLRGLLREVGRRNNEVEEEAGVK
ncbi:MAG: hypothetical protein ACYTFY_02265 [Planctomycetota bacterium]|jgi:hypothetical protein